VLDKADHQSQPTHHSQHWYADGDPEASQEQANASKRGHACYQTDTSIDQVT
jgi:hypothetical protein